MISIDLTGIVRGLGGLMNNIARFRFLVLPLAVGSFVLGSGSARAQLVPDESLGQERSQLTPQGDRTLIQGGAQRGSALFHSFQEFNIDAGQRVDFANPEAVDRIFARVTGRNPSNLLGTLGVLGRADLFLLNPNGIVFGANARLDVNGSFLATTGDRLQFDNFEFSARNPAGLSSSLLTVSAPLGIQFGTRPGAIRYQTAAFREEGAIAPELAVKQGQNLAFLGGDIEIHNGRLTAPQGAILLGSAADGMVGLNLEAAGWNWEVGELPLGGEVRLSGTAVADVSGEGGGQIRVGAGRVLLRDRARLQADTLGAEDGRGIDIDAQTLRLRDEATFSSMTLASGAGGSIRLRTDTLNLSGVNFETMQFNYFRGILRLPVDPLNRVSGLFVGTTSTGESGEIQIDTRQLRLQQGSIITSPTFSSGRGGDLRIRVTEDAQVRGSAIVTTAFNRGRAGDLQMQTGNVTVLDGGTMSTTTFGDGRGGNLSIQARDTVRVVGAWPTALVPSNLSTFSVNGTGDSGRLAIAARAVRVEDGGAITTSNGVVLRNLGYYFSDGRGGNLVINASDSVVVTGFSPEVEFGSLIITATHGRQASGNLRLRTQRLLLDQGGIINASTVSSGQGGNAFIEASESIEIRGVVRIGDLLFPSRLETLSGDALLADLLPPNSFRGDAGRLRVVTGRLTVSDHGRINVASIGTGRSGEITLRANAIDIDRNAEINATTNRNGRGNIDLAANRLFVQGGSRITTDARQSTGGNIALRANELMVVQQGEITANAIAGRGGNIDITTPSLVRDATSPITASSRLGLDGRVTIRSAFEDPDIDTVELPETIGDESDRMVAGCPSDREASFVVTRRGGLPEDPRQMVEGQVVVQDWRRQSGLEDSGEGGRSQLPSTPTASIQEAQGWRTTAAGKIELVATASTTEAIGEGVCPIAVAR